RPQSCLLQLPWCIIALLRGRPLLKFAIRFRPAPSRIEQRAIPESTPAGDAFRLGLGSGPKRFVTFNPIMRIKPADKINRTGDNCVTNLIKSWRVDQSA